MEVKKPNLGRQVAFLVPDTFNFPVGNGFDRIRRLYSIIVEFGTPTLAGIKYSGPGINLVMTSQVRCANEFCTRGMEY